MGLPVIGSFTLPTFIIGFIILFIFRSQCFKTSLSSSLTLRQARALIFLEFFGLIIILE
jgi:hypothetical protein